MNKRSNLASPPRAEPIEEGRRAQLIEVTLDCLAQEGFAGSTLLQIAKRAGVSAGLVAHYFGDKEGLLEAAFRALVRRVGEQVRLRRQSSHSPRARIQAVIDANLSPVEFDRRTGTAWLAFWGQVLQSETLRRVQSVYQRRMLSNLRSSLCKLLPRKESHQLAEMIAAMIDGVWLRAALSGWTEVDSGSARALLTEFVDGRLNVYAASMERKPPAPDTALATGGNLTLTAAVAIARSVKHAWSERDGSDRAGILQRAASLLRERAGQFAELEARETAGSTGTTPSQNVGLAADSIERFAAIARRLGGESMNLGAHAIGYSQREPLGVVWGRGSAQHPLQSVCWQAGAALACANVMIFKPAAGTPSTAMALAGLFQESGLPSGVFQIVQESAEADQDPSRQPDLAVVTMRGLEPERGAHAALFVFDDADLDAAVTAASTVDAGAVVFVQAGIEPEFRRRLQLHGAMPSRRQESFGTDEELLQRARELSCGIGAAVYTRDLARARRLIPALDVPTCRINHAGPWPFAAVPGADTAAIEHYSRLKTIVIDTNTARPG